MGDLATRQHNSFTHVYNRAWKWEEPFWKVSWSIFISPTSLHDAKMVCSFPSLRPPSLSSLAFTMKWKIFRVRDWQTYFFRENDFPSNEYRHSRNVLKPRISWWFIVDTLCIFKAIKINIRCDRMYLAYLNNTVESMRESSIKNCILHSALVVAAAARFFTSRWVFGCAEESLLKKRRNFPHKGRSGEGQKSY